MAGTACCPMSSRCSWSTVSPVSVDVSTTSAGWRSRNSTIACAHAAEPTEGSGRTTRLSAYFVRMPGAVRPQEATASRYPARPSDRAAARPARVSRLRISASCFRDIRPQYCCVSARGGRLTCMLAVAALALVVTGCTPRSLRPQAGAAPTRNASPGGRGLSCTSQRAARMPLQVNRAHPFRTIQHAADLVRPGETIVVTPGTYAEDLTLARSGTPTAPVRLTSSGAERPLLTGRIKVTASNAIISGLIFAGRTEMNPTDVAVYIFGWRGSSSTANERFATLRNRGSSWVRARPGSPLRELDPRQRLDSFSTTGSTTRTAAAA